MQTVQDVLDAIEAVAPARFAFSFDRIGLQLGDPNAEVSTVVVALDPSLAAARFARASGAQMLVCHHPLIWEPLEHLRLDSFKGRIVAELVQGGIAFAAAHTNWDCAPGGINDVLAELLGLSGVTSFGSANPCERSKIVVTAPKGTEDALIDAMSARGAGLIGLYERCAFVGDGTGTFRGLPGSSPMVGESGSVESVPESRIEMCCSQERVDGVVDALVSAHPYEEPAYDVYALRTGMGQPAGRIGSLSTPMSLESFVAHLDRALDTRTLLCRGSSDEVRRVAVVGGAAADEWKAALDAGADAFVTGEAPHHVMVEASECGLGIAACGHYATENPGTMRLAESLRGAFEVLSFEPLAGASGRPV